MSIGGPSAGFRHLLRSAVAEGNLPALRKLLAKKRMPLQCPDPDNGWPLLFYAIRYGQNNLVEYLLNNGHEDKGVSKDFENNTALMIAADYRNEDAFHMYVVRYRQTVGMVNTSGKTALIIAIQRGLLDVVAVLLERGAQVNSTDSDGSTPLHHAAAWGHEDIVTMLMEYGAAHNILNARGWTPSDYAYSLDMREHLDECVAAITENRPIQNPSLREKPQAAPQLPPKLDLRTLF